MKIIVEFSLPKEWDIYIPDNEEKVKCLIKDSLSGVKTKIIDIKNSENK